MEAALSPLAAVFIRRLLAPRIFVVFSALSVLPFAGHAQVLTKTNPLASYSYDATNAFVPSDPLASASGSLSTFSFLPTDFSVSSSGAASATNTVTALITLDMAANPGFWFDGPGVSMNLNAQVNYSLAAPTATSSARADFSAPFTLLVTAVNGSPFAPSGLPIATNMTITPPFAAATGPGSFPSGSISGAFAFDINTIKAHFGIAAGSNITAMRLQVSPLLTVQSERGSATASIVNFDVASQVVPEPSTYALLMLGAGAVGFTAWRRRRG
jgi:hypothetical protein